MSSGQAAALHALVHVVPPARASRWTRRGRGIDVVWAATLAALFALGVASVGREAFVAVTDGPHAVATVRQSSVASGRTM